MNCAAPSLGSTIFSGCKRGFQCLHVDQALHSAMVVETLWCNRKSQSIPLTLF